MKKDEMQFQQRPDDAAGNGTERSKVTISEQWTEAERASLIALIEEDREKLTAVVNDIKTRVFYESPQLRMLGEKQLALKNLQDAVRIKPAEFLEPNRLNFSDYIL